MLYVGCLCMAERRLGRAESAIRSLQEHVDEEVHCENQR